MESPIVNAQVHHPAREPKASLRGSVPANRVAVRVPRSAVLRPDEFLDIVAKGRRR